jgi:histidine ammonia-lyase
MSLLWIDGKTLTLEDVNRVSKGNQKVSLKSDAEERLIACRQVIEAAIEQKKTIYGVNTGFGKFSDILISESNLLQLQENLILSHAAGIGKPLAPELVRTILLLKANTLAKGYSGVRPVIVQRLLELLNQDILPVIPEKGSVGASGDLAPLAHLTLVLIGQGEVFSQQQRLAGEQALAHAGIEPVKLQAKEGLALLNGTQVTTALAVMALLRLEHLTKVADIIGAMSTETLKGTPTAFDPRIHQVRGLAGQMRVADNLLRLLKDSQIVLGHKNCSKVQDAYSLRCMPQVHGTVRDACQFIHSILSTEINSATDNPLIFLEENDILSGGNFHAQPVSMVADLLGIVAAQLANISERRIEYMLDPDTSRLAGFLTEAGGLNSGFMMAQVTAASLVSENKVLAHPASVDSIPTSANKEDFVSMGTFAARKALEIVQNSEYVLAIELLCAAQGLDFEKKLLSSLPIDHALKRVRAAIPHWGQDRLMAPEIEKAYQIIRSEQFVQEIEAFTGVL